MSLKKCICIKFEVTLQILTLKYVLMTHNKHGNKLWESTRVAINFLIINTWGHAGKAEQWIARDDGTHSIVLKN